MEGGRTVTKIYAVAVPLLLLWLVGWIVFSWGAMQDDALIHLRYADNLAVHHFITYDGVHANYGASSLLYVSALALLRRVTSSPELPHAASSVMHLLLFGWLTALFARIARGSEMAGKAGLVLLLLLSTPSAVRWLDDGMETVMVTGLVSLLAWLLHTERYDRRSSWPRYDLMVLISFLAVLLRIELSLLCAAGFFLLVMARVADTRNWWETRGVFLGRLINAVMRSAHLLIGCGLSLGLIYKTMHALLPDTALAKSHGIGSWFNPLQDTASTLSSALSFGLGTCCFWLLMLALTIRHDGKIKPETAIANGLFPLLLLSSVVRGQEIQGVRYFAWTFLFPIVWNILELARAERGHADSQLRRTLSGAVQRRLNVALVYGFLGCIALMLPMEAVMMHNVLLHRQETLHLFESQRLEVLKMRRGIASDIGYIGYFTQADICDLAGLVNGREASRMESAERARACVRKDADFIFVNLSQLMPLTRMIDLTGWAVCGRYEFTNLKRPDIHYLLVRPEMKRVACAAASRLPEPIESILPARTGGV
jgi:hypothetical protein